MSDFWETLAANSSSQLLMGSIDSLLGGKAVGDDFEGVRTLTDVHREANALPLPVEAGTKVSFIGTLGAYMGYEDPPPRGAVGEVVNVKSANGDVTYHEGKVFVQWSDGKFRPIHAEHLRLAGSTSKTASKVVKIRKDDKGNGLWIEARGKLEGPLTAAQVLSKVDSYLDDPDVVIMGRNHSLGRSGAADPYSTAPFVVYDKRGDMVDEGYSLKSLWDKWFDRFLGWRMASDKTARDQTLMTWTYHSSDGDGGKTTTITAEIKVDGRGNLMMEEKHHQEDWGGAPDRSHSTEKRLGTVRDPDLQTASRIFSDKKKGWTAKGRRIRSPIQYLKKVLGEQPGRLASSKTADLKAEFKKIKDLAKKKPDNKFLDSVLEQLSKGHTLTEKQLKVIKTIEGEVKEMASMQKQLKTLESKKAEEDNWRRTSFRIASLGDLTDFLKVSEETLVHKSTNDLWSVAADGDGFTLTRLFDDEGEPLKG